MTQFKTIDDIKTKTDRRRAHQMLDDIGIPRGELAWRIEVLSCRYPESKNDTVSTVD